MKKNMCVSIGKENYHRLHVIVSIKKFFFGEHSVSMSSIIEQALDEYFDTHKEEIDNLMKRYHEKGGCGDL